MSLFSMTSARASALPIDPDRSNHMLEAIGEGRVSRLESSQSEVVKASICWTASIERTTLVEGICGSSKLPSSTGRNQAGTLYLGLEKRKRLLMFLARQKGEFLVIKGVARIEQRVSQTLTICRRFKLNCPE